MFYGGIEGEITAALEKAATGVFADAGVAGVRPKNLTVELEIPKDRSHGDLSANIAMRACKLVKEQPLALAERIRSRLSVELTGTPLSGAIDRIETKPPGFINFHVSRPYLAKTLLDIKRTKEKFGRSAIGRSAKVQVEFVSANPTGPLTIAHGRQAAIGDSLANILSALGYRVTREYYLNDKGVQMNNLANSIRVRYRELAGIVEEFPVDGYKGGYVQDVAKDFKARYGARHLETKDLKVFRDFGLRWMMNDIRKDLKDFGVRFDVWYSQIALERSGKVEKALKLLKDKGHIFENEGAVWFRSTSFGDDKDRVVVKSDRSMTYLAPDIAYHLDKFRRGFSRIIDLWGPDHHGYVPRMKAAIRALGYPADSFSALIVQLATLFRGGQAVSMSTRAGEFITLREVMDEAGKDVARSCFLMRRTSSHLDFDLEVVKKESAENPIYYIQYAHARIWSIIGYSRGLRFSSRFDSSLLSQDEELLLMRMLRQFPMIVSLSGATLEPYVVLQYLQDLAAAFHSFYNKHRVISDDRVLTGSRLVLVDCVRIVLANGLKLLGVSLPRKM